MLAAGSMSVWYLTRGAGAVSLVLLTASFALGLPTLLSTGTERMPRLVVQLLHRNLSLLSVVFVLVHVATTVVDGFAPIGWLDAVVPFRAGYRPIWLGLGAVAVDLLLAVIITSLARVRIGYRRWRQVHHLAYAMWPIALVHALGTGSDSRAAWMWWLDGACVAVVIGVTALRLVQRAPRDARVRAVALGGLVVVPLAIAVWTVAGPLKSTWGKTHHTTVVQTTDAPTGDDAPAGSTP